MVTSTLRHAAGHASGTTLTRRRFSMWVGASALGTMLSGLPRTARAATGINYLGWQGYDEALSANEFLAKNSLEVKSTYITTNEDILTKLRAGGVGSVDLCTAERKYLVLMVLNGVLEPIDVAAIPNFKRVMPFIAEQPSLRHEGKLYAIPFTWGMQPMMYRPDMVSEVPTSWLDVLKPEYKGKVVMAGPWSANIQVWAPVVTGTTTPTRITSAQLKETVDFMIKIKKEHARTYTASYGEMADVLARGEAVISTMGWEPIVKWVAKKGAKVAMVYPKEGTTGFIDTYILPKNSPNREMNLKLINNVLSVGAQKILVEKLGQAIVNLDAIAELTPEERSIYPYDKMDTISKIARFYPMPPLEPDGTNVTYSDMVKEWERFKKA